MCDSNHMEHNSTVWHALNMTALQANVFLKVTNLLLVKSKEGAFSPNVNQCKGQLHILHSLYVLV